ncbi:hypothetical protein ACFWBN_03800 [Streptomyces sp. NPDC059989]|uniref:hypothetical protein n=1 Tax=Streptomyces sp. NPDC059989 TaxID=3347026 RepID=UPI00367B4CEA
MKIKNMLAAGALALAAVSAAAPMASAAAADDTPAIADAAALAGAPDDLDFHHVGDLTNADALGDSPLVGKESWGAEESPSALSDLANFTDGLDEAARQALEDGQ